MRKALMIFSYLLLFAGMAVAAYPSVYGVMMNRKATQIAEDFLSTTAPTPSSGEASSSGSQPTEEMRPYAELWDGLWSYNENLYKTSQIGMENAASLSETAFYLAEYGLDSEVFGVLSIPAIDLCMPLYLGATRENMAQGAAIMGYTSIPIGSPNSNTVICGHRGWNGAAYFLHIDKIQIGDMVIITNLWEEMNYQVTGTQIISPDDLDAVKIQPGKDMITLLSCHPVASGGKQRYLVFCEKVP